MPAKHTPGREQREQVAMQKLFEQRSHIGGRLPQILEPTPPVHHMPKPVEVPPEGQQTEPEMPRRGRGARMEKKTGLHVVLQGIKVNGFPHPANGGFIMVPRVMNALLSLERVAVIQVVFEICAQTVGWEDKHGKHGRREWVRLSIRHFEIACGMKASQVVDALKRAVQQGYIRRRPRAGGNEYAIRWAEEADEQGRGTP
jgi:hypothetical protein